MTESELYKHSDSRNINAHFECFDKGELDYWIETAKNAVFAEQTSDSKSPYALNLQNEWVREQYEAFREAYGIEIPSDKDMFLFEKRVADHYYEHGANGTVSFPKTTARRRIIFDEDLSKCG